MIATISYRHEYFKAKLLELHSTSEDGNIWAVEPLTSIYSDVGFVYDDEGRPLFSDVFFQEMEIRVKKIEDETLEKLLNWI